MSNFDIARTSFDTAENGSEGSAERELENIQKGIDYSIQRLQASFQELSTKTINADIFKGLIDGGTAALNVLTQLVDKAGLLPTVLSGVAIGKSITTFVKGFDYSPTFG